MLRKIVTLIIIFFCAPSMASISSNTTVRMQRFLEQWRRAHEIPAIVLTIKKLPQNKMYTFVSGTTALNGNEKITANNLFQIGSLTKTFISAVILQLAAEGKLNLNDTFEKWFPEYGRWQNITIQQLLNMSSGIYNYSDAIKWVDVKKDKRHWQPNELVDLAYKYKDYFRAGQGWRYSNTNYILAGMLIERVTAKRLAVVLNERLLSKLKLNNTFYVPYTYPKLILERMALGYHNKDDVTLYSMSAYGAAGAMVSNSEDMAKWITLLFKDQVLPPEQHDELLKMVLVVNHPPIPAGSHYGLGLYATNIPKLGTIWWYSGVTEGYISLFAWIPSKQAIITATINQRLDDNVGLLMPKSAFFNTVIKLLRMTAWR